MTCAALIGSSSESRNHRVKSGKSAKQGPDSTIFSAMRKAQKRDQARQDVTAARRKTTHSIRPTVRLAQNSTDFRYFKAGDEAADLSEYYMEGNFGFGDDPMEPYPLEQQKMDAAILRQNLLGNLREVESSEQISIGDGDGDNLEKMSDEDQT